MTVIPAPAFAGAGPGGNDVQFSSIEYLFFSVFSVVNVFLALRLCAK